MEIQGPLESPGFSAFTRTDRVHGGHSQHSQGIHNKLRHGGGNFLRGRFTFGPSEFGDFFENKFGNARIQFGQNGRFRLLIRGPNGHHNALSGIKVGDDIFIRRANGDIIQADMIKDEESGEFGLFGMTVLSSPPTSPEDLGESSLLQFTGEGNQFESTDGVIRGRYDPGSNRISGVITTPEGEELGFEGLVGDGFVVIGLENGESFNIAFTPLQDGSYVLRGLSEAVQNATDPNPPPFVQGPKIIKDTAAGGVAEDPLGTLLELFDDEGDTHASNSIDTLA